MQSAEVRTVWKHSTTKKVEMRCGKKNSLLVFILVILLTESLESDALAKSLELVCASWFQLGPKKSEVWNGSSNLPHIPHLQGKSYCHQVTGTRQQANKCGKPVGW